MFSEISVCMANATDRGEGSCIQGIRSLLLGCCLVFFISQHKKSWFNLSWPLISLEHSFSCCPTMLIQSQLCLAQVNFALGIMTNDCSV